MILNACVWFAGERTLGQSVAVWAGWVVKDRWGFAR